MSTLQLWLSGYADPVRFVDDLMSRRAPQLGFYATLLRGLLNSLLLYLPLYLMGRVPPTPSNLSFLSTERYYGSLIWLTPLVSLVIWLLQSTAIHLVLRLSGRASDMDRILNITGVVGLVDGTFLLAWDWLWAAVGDLNPYWLGSTHLVIALWAAGLTALGLQCALGVRARISVPLSLLPLLVSLPIGVMFMRSPV